MINKKNANTPTALNIALLKKKYQDVLKEWESKNQGLKPPYHLIEEDVVVSDIQGKKFSGLDKLTKNFFAMTIIPYRDKTILISTDGIDSNDTYKSQYEKTLSSFELRK